MWHIWPVKVPRQFCYIIVFVITYISRRVICHLRINLYEKSFLNWSFVKEKSIPKRKKSTEFDKIGIVPSKVLTITFPENYIWSKQGSSWSLTWMDQTPSVRRYAIRLASLIWQNPSWRNLNYKKICLKIWCTSTFFVINKIYKFYSNFLTYY